VLKRKKLFDNNYIIISSNDTILFSIAEEKIPKYSDPKWMNTTEEFFLPETDGGSILNIFDNCGSLRDTVHLQIEENEIDLYGVYFSRNDSLILFASRYNQNILPSGSPSIPGNINVYDYKSHKLIFKMDTVAPGIKIKIEELPWSSDNSCFTFAISDRYSEMFSKLHSDTLNYKLDEGVYVANIIDNRITKISNKGEKSVWSPADNKIAYFANDKVYVYDLDSNETKEIYSTTFYEVISRLHWSPDGRYLYIECPKKYFNSKLLLFHREKAIELNSLQVIDIDSENFFGSDYSWK